MQHVNVQGDAAEIAEDAVRDLDVQRSGEIIAVEQGERDQSDAQKCDRPALELEVSGLPENIPEKQRADDNVEHRERGPGSLGEFARGQAADHVEDHHADEHADHDKDDAVVETDGSGRVGGAAAHAVGGSGLRAEGGPGRLRSTGAPSGPMSGWRCCC